MRLARAGTRSALLSVYVRRNSNRKRVDRVPLRATGICGMSQTPLGPTQSREVLMIACPKCGETRLIERVDRHRWFCAVCAHTWTTQARTGITKSWASAFPYLQKVSRNVVMNMGHV